MGFEPQRFAQTGVNNDIDEMGKDLSVIIGCCVRFSPYGKPAFECEHMVSFPLFAIKPAWQTNKWYDIYRKHEDEKDLIQE